MTEHKSWFYTVVCELAAAAYQHQPARLRDDTLSACRKAINEHDRERAVIEAAKAFVGSYQQEIGYATVGKLDELRAAIEALQEVEGE